MQTTNYRMSEFQTDSTFQAPNASTSYKVTRLENAETGETIIVRVEAPIAELESAHAFVMQAILLRGVRP